MDDIQQANKYKQLGNEAFTAKDYHKAAEYFTKAIDLNSEDHVFYSNRSACYANLNEYDKALVDAQICVDIKPDWAKGYLRRGLAEFYLKKYAQAEKTYQEGLKLEPSNQQLLEGLEKAKQELKSHAGEGAGGNVDKEKLFNDAIAHLQQDPETKHFFEDSEFVNKLNDVKSNPMNITKYMNDPKVMKAIEVIKAKFSGANANKGGAAQGAGAANASHAGTQASQGASAGGSEAENEKNKGNEEYKKKNFTQAIHHYDKAIELNPKEPIYYNNKAAVYLEMKDADKVIELCGQAIKVGKANGGETQADKLKLAKAYNRLATAYIMKNNLDEAIKAYEHSLAEHLDQTVINEIDRLENLKAGK